MTGKRIYDAETIGLILSHPGTAREVSRITGMSVSYAYHIRAGGPRRPPRRRGGYQVAAASIVCTQPDTPAAAAAAAMQARTAFLARLQSARDVAGIWAGLLL